MSDGQSKRRRGRSAERTARRFLEKAGMRLLDENWQARCGELDLVMQDGETLVFVEVRYRGAGAWADGAASIDSRKQARVIRAAQLWLQRHGNPDRPCRFDVISLGRTAEPDWIRNAFGA
ncbi:YraN family protein [Methylonatrum kenyense]|uniref:YraN family protein n=1 Tax=Methylonatrum kenyense TaxID=455253 RepID=UPI0020BFF1B6|nr:YraN family protein [Methylonatrum kenyense]MCK8516280.1 YraN family protein [Methylonatrum kenyense]